MPNPTTAAAPFAYEAIVPGHKRWNDWNSPPGRTVHSHGPKSTWPRRIRNIEAIGGGQVWVPDCFECAEAIRHGVEPRVMPSPFAPLGSGPVPTSGPLGPLGGVRS